MKRVLKKATYLLILALLISSILTISAYANSAQSYWRGVDSAGAMVVGGSCPIEVTSELLTIDITEFPQGYYRETEDFLKYSGKVTAEYAFYNPTDLTITATLAFPFGELPDYAPIRYNAETNSYSTDIDTEKYDITVNGEAVEKSIRYTYKPTGVQFALYEDLSKLSDTYLSDEFYYHTMPVTKYTYIVGGADKEGQIDTEKYRAASVAFDWDGGDGRTKIYFPEQSGFHTQKDGDGRLSTWADNGKMLTVYIIGQQLSTPLTMKCYEDGGVKDNEEIDGIVSLINTEAMTLEDLALENWSEELGASKVDWYNAIISAFKDGGKGNPRYNYILPDSYGVDLSGVRFMNSLMRWYEYEITLEPKESIINTVTAPLYPEIDLSYDPDIYSYTYLLSPASTWVSFGELDIVINTPFYITESSLEGFTKSDTGYTMKLDGLPEEELEFTLSTSENPIKPSNSIIKYALSKIIIGVVGAALLIGIIGVVLLIGGITLAIVIKRRRK